MEPETIPRNCYGYVRVSTIKQAEEGMSLDLQHKKIEAWCVMKDHHLIKIFKDEGISGATIDKRPGLSELMDTIKETDILVIYTMSRLSRSVKDFVFIANELEKKKCKLVCIKESIDTSSAYGKFTANLFASLCQLESDMSKERTLETMKFKAENGEFVGRPPYGWKQLNGKGTDLVEIPEEQAVIARIKEMRAVKHKLTTKKDAKEKHTSYQAIADVLNNEGIKPSDTAKLWYASAIKRILDRGIVKTKGKPAKINKVVDIEYIE